MIENLLTIIIDILTLNIPQQDSHIYDFSSSQEDYALSPIIMDNNNKPELVGNSTQIDYKSPLITANSIQKGCESPQLFMNNSQGDCESLRLSTNNTPEGCESPRL